LHRTASDGRLATVNRTGLLAVSMADGVVSYVNCHVLFTMIA
jgi:hypothetical protein